VNARAGIAALAAAMLAGCALYGSDTLEEGAPGVMHASPAAAAQAQAQVHPGSSSKGDVAAALGRGNVVAFDSGWEVWVYRWPGADRSNRAATELVVLFDPRGIARKVRVRPGTAA
jgi:hypothetical protein